jgi:hypothetical protein
VGENFENYAQQLRSEPRGGPPSIGGISMMAGTINTMNLEALNQRQNDRLKKI